MNNTEQSIDIKNDQGTQNTQNTIEIEPKQDRLSELASWVSKCYSFKPELKALNNDASFRKYYRFQNGAQTLIAVDAPPDTENNRAFIGVQNILNNNNVNVPDIIYSNLDAGFFVIEDFGDDLLLPKLKVSNQPELLYELSLEQLLKIQASNISNNHNQDYYQLPYFDRKLFQYELELFRDWFVSQYLNIKLTEQQNNLLVTVFEEMIVNAHEQPQILVHRDFHSRNLIILNNQQGNQIGVIDFQDALVGPLTYDLVSLYRDCYISWSLEQVKTWVLKYYNLAIDKNIISQDIDFGKYWDWFLKMTLQRNFKTIGIFARLYLRDNKDQYLNDIPRTLDYAITVSRILAQDDYDGNNKKLYLELNNFFVNAILPKLEGMQSD